MGPLAGGPCALAAVWQPTVRGVEQRDPVAGAGGVCWQAAPAIEKGGGLEAESGGGIGGGVLLVGACARVEQLGGGLAEALEQGLQDEGVGNGCHTLCSKVVRRKLSPGKLAFSGSPGRKSLN